MLKSPRTGFVNVLNQAIKKKRAFVIGVPFENRHHEDEPLKVFQSKHMTKYEIAAGLRDITVNRRRGGAGAIWAWLQRVNRVLHDRSLRPGMCPRMENTVRLNAVFETGNKALLRVRVIGRKQKREPIQAVHLFCEESAKIFYACVLTGLNLLDLILPSAVHGVVS